MPNRTESSSGNGRQLDHLSEGTEVDETAEMNASYVHEDHKGREAVILNKTARRNWEHTDGQPPYILSDAEKGERARRIERNLDREFIGEFLEYAEAAKKVQFYVEWYGGSLSENEVRDLIHPIKKMFKVVGYKVIGAEVMDKLQVSANTGNQ